MQTKKIALITMLFIYTVLCGIIIADSGTSSVAGSERPVLVDKFVELVWN